MARQGSPGQTTNLRILHCACVFVCAIASGISGFPACAEDMVVAKHYSIALDDDSFVLPFGEPLRFTLQSNEANENNTTDLVVDYRLINVESGKVVSRLSLPMKGDGDAEPPSLQVHDDYQPRPGVYEIRCHQQKRSFNFIPLRNNDAGELLAAMTLVVKPKSPQSSAKIHWKKLAEIKPSQRQVWRLPSWVSASRPTNERTVASLTSGETYSTALPKLNPHRPYRITLKYPTNQTLHLQLEVSHDDFASVAKRIKFTDQTPIYDQDKTLSQSFLLFPSEVQNSIRVTNLDDKPNSFDLIQIDQAEYQDRVSSTTDDNPGVDRLSLLQLDDAKWVQQITSDFDAKSESASDLAFLPTTHWAQQNKLAAERLSNYLDAAGYNGVILPNHGGQNQQSGVPVEIPIPDPTELVSAFMDSSKRIFVTDTQDVQPEGLETETDQLKPSNTDSHEQRANLALVSSADSLSSSISQTNFNVSDESALRIMIPQVALPFVHTSHHTPTTLAEFTRLVSADIPQVTIVREQNLNCQWSHELAKALNRIQSLPSTPFAQTERYDTLGTTIRTSRHGEDVFTILTNQSPWTNEIGLGFTDAPDFGSSQKADNETSWWQGQGNRAYASLGPNGILVIRGKLEKNAGLQEWQSRISGGEPAEHRIRGQVTAVVERIAALSQLREYLKLTNPGFEKPTGVGIAGWMHSKRSDHSISIDSQEAIEGNQSIVIRNASSDSKPWILSERFKAPDTGRLAVSIAFRAELNETQSVPHQVRIAIEGSGTNREIPIKKIDVPRTGKWQPRSVVLEVSNLKPTAPDELVLTITSLSAGKLWIDDVHLHDWFPLESERRDLQGQAFLAMKGLQRDDFSGAAVLLHNPWARGLLGHRPFDMPAQNVTQKTSNKIERKHPSVAERIKGWLPGPLRF